jgi:HTH-type transcriptional regulator/antitoxin HipB
MKYVITTPEQLSHVIRSVRKAKSLRQIDVADRIGLLPKTISALENHPETVTMESFFKMLSALDLELTLFRKRT